MRSEIIKNFLESVKEMQMDGQQLSEQGQQRAIDHADRVNEGWSEKAYRMIQFYVKAYGSIPFMAEQVRQYCKEEGLPDPPDSRAFGALFLRLKKEGVIQFLRYVPSENKHAHRRPTALYKRK